MGRWWDHLPEDIERVEERPGGFTADLGMPTDEVGYMGRECSICAGFFKLHAEDIGRISDDDSVWCPYCGEQGHGVRHLRLPLS